MGHTKEHKFWREERKSFLLTGPFWHNNPILGTNSSNEYKYALLAILDCMVFYSSMIKTIVSNTVLTGIYGPTNKQYPTLWSGTNRYYHVLLFLIDTVVWVAYHLVHQNHASPVNYSDQYLKLGTMKASSISRIQFTDEWWHNHLRPRFKTSDSNLCRPVSVMIIFDIFKETPISNSIRNIDK